MSIRFRYLALPACACALICGAVVLCGQTARGQDGAQRPSSWWRPPADVRSMLRNISAQRLEADDRALAGFGTRSTLSSRTDPKRGIGAAGEWVFDQLKAAAATSSGRMTVELGPFIQRPVPGRIPLETSMTNIVATLKGSDPESADRVYVVGAHYDSRPTDLVDGESDAPGADDNGSGTAAVLELARVMAAHPSEATIVFVAFDGEEQGLFGSDDFARLFTAAGVKPQGVLNLDVIGNPLGGNGARAAHTIRMFSEGSPILETPAQAVRRRAFGNENDGVSRQLARYVKETGENPATGMGVKLIWRRDRYLGSGDQISFHQQGQPAVRLTESKENYDHQHQDVRVENGKQFGDLPEFVDFDYLARVTRVVGSTLAALTRSPGTPRNAQMTTAARSYDTELQWDADSESDLAGYEVVWRASTQARWTHARQVGNVTHYTFAGLDKDDNQVGVRAVDRDGNRSPVAFPIPTSP